MFEILSPGISLMFHMALQIGHFAVFLHLEYKELLCVHTHMCIHNHYSIFNSKEYELTFPPLVFCMSAM